MPYTLADRRPCVRPGRRLLIDLQGRSHLDPEFCLVAIANGQIVLTTPGEEFYERLDWSGDEPTRSVPPIRINPLVRFGMPRSANSAARPSTRGMNSARVNVTSPHVTAG